MKAKWYISTFIIILAVLGLHQEQDVVPNQEIVLQFSDVRVASCEVTHTLSIVTKQLQVLGISNVQIQHQEKGLVKIAYYSDADVASVKRILFKTQNLGLGYTSFKGNTIPGKGPSDKTTKTYNLDIYEIQGDDGITSGLNGKYIFEVKQEYDRFSNPNLYPFLSEISVRDRDNIVKVAYKINKIVTIAIDNTSHVIPEVRAGPSV